MARDGSGNYSIPNTFTAGTVIASAAVNANFADIATALTNSLARNGEGPMTAVLPLDTTGFVYSADPDTGIKRSGANEQTILVGGGSVIVISTATVSISAAINLFGALAISGAFSLASTLTVTGSTASFLAEEMISTDAGALAGPLMNLYRNSASPAASDVLGLITWYGKDSGNNKTEYGAQGFQISDATDASEDGQWFVRATINGTPTVIINSTGAQIGIPGTLAVTGAVTGASQTVTNDQSAATASGSQIASQAEQEAASVTNKLVTPGRQHFHAGHPKCGGKFDTTAAFSASYGVTSGTDNGSGDWTANLAVTFSSANYWVSYGNEPSGGAGTNGGGAVTRNTGQGTNTLRINTWQANSGSFTSVVDDAQTYFSAYGDL